MQELGSRETNQQQREGQNEQGGHDRPRCADDAEQHHRHAEEHERPGSEAVDVRADHQGLGCRLEKQAQGMPVENLDQDDDRSGQHHAEQDTDAGCRMDAIPFLGADVLRRHGRNRHADGECRHLDVVPDLHGRSVGGRGVDAKRIDEGDHQHGAERNHEHLRAHRHAFLHQRADDDAVHLQQLHFIRVQQECVLALVKVPHHRGQADALRHQRRERRTCDPQARNRADAKDEDRVQDDVDENRQQHEIERGLGIAGAAQHRHDERIHVHERQREEDHAHVGNRQRERTGRRLHGDEQRLAQDPAGNGHDDGQQGEEGRARADDALGLAQVIGADALAHQDRRGHGDPESGSDEQEHHGVRVGGGGQGRLAQIAPHPDGVHRAVQRLQDVGK